MTTGAFEQELAAQVRNASALWATARQRGDLAELAVLEGRLDDLAELALRHGIVAEVPHHRVVQLGTHATGLDSQEPVAVRAAS
jgi:hypothetical protein